MNSAINTKYSIKSVLKKHKKFRFINPLKFRNEFINLANQGRSQNLYSGGRAQAKARRASQL